MGKKKAIKSIKENLKQFDKGFNENRPIAWVEENGTKKELDSFPTNFATKPDVALLNEELRGSIPDDDERFKEVCRIMNEEPERVPDVDMVLPVVGANEAQPVPTEEAPQSPEEYEAVEQEEQARIKAEQEYQAYRQHMKTRRAFAKVRVETKQIQNLSIDQMIDCAEVIANDRYVCEDEFIHRREQY